MSVYLATLKKITRTTSHICFDLAISVAGQFVL